MDVYSLIYGTNNKKIYPSAFPGEQPSREVLFLYLCIFSPEEHIYYKETDIYQSCFKQTIRVNQNKTKLCKETGFSFQYRWSGSGR